MPQKSTVRRHNKRKVTKMNLGRRDFSSLHSLVEKAVQGYPPLNGGAAQQKPRFVLVQGYAKVL
jgi:hypothetical protein